MLRRVQASLASTTRRASGAPARTAAMRSASPSPPSFSLSSGRSRGARAASRHRSPACRGSACRRSSTGRGAGRPASCPGRTAGTLRLEVPQRAVERVARRPGRHAAPQVLRGRPAATARAALDRAATLSTRLAVARIGHALAAPAAPPSLDLATTTSASVRAPREIVNAPAIGKRSTARSTRQRAGITRVADPSTSAPTPGADRIDRRQAHARPRSPRGSALASPRRAPPC